MESFVKQDMTLFCHDKGVIIQCKGGKGDLIVDGKCGANQGWKQ